MKFYRNDPKDPKDQIARTIVAASRKFLDKICRQTIITDIISLNQDIPYGVVMIIKEDIHIDLSLQANFPELVIARGKVLKQSLHSRGLSQIYEEFTGTGR